jgi:methylthioribose-1-phosphate isomerase
MWVDDEHYRSLWVADDSWTIEIIDQTRLPHEFMIVSLETLDHAIHAIKTMQVRGAPLIGITAAYGVGMAMRADSSDAALETAIERLQATRPTASNLAWALEEMRQKLAPLQPEERINGAYRRARELVDHDIMTCKSIGAHGVELIRDIAKRKDGKPVNILTHCNAGWLATIDWGTALSPIYRAYEDEIPVHVWVDETRPRNQGAALTAWELGKHGIEHTVIVDNAGGHLMQLGLVDICIVGTDRTTAGGDVCNKIGTYLKALAAHDNGVPFFVALPSSTIDWSLESGADIPIEQRGAEEVSHVYGLTDDGKVGRVDVIAPGSEVVNPAFDVTPRHLVTGLITEQGICGASREALAKLFPVQAG